MPSALPEFRSNTRAATPISGIGPALETRSLVLGINPSHTGKEIIALGGDEHDDA